MKCQLVTALGAICGTMVSLTFGKDSEFKIYYLSLVFYHNDKNDCKRKANKDNLCYSF